MLRLGPSGWAAPRTPARSTSASIPTGDRSPPTSPPIPRTPSDPAYDWTETDGRVASARAQGLEPILTILSAPRWADANNSPNSARPGTWMPDPTRFGNFGSAIARRYSGQVGFYEAWNEPNLDNYLTPQWNGKPPASPDHSSRRSRSRVSRSSRPRSRAKRASRPRSARSSQEPGRPP